MKRIAIVVFSVVACSAPSLGQNVTGNQLHALCTSSGTERAVAAGYVVGAADAIVAAQDAGWTERKLCLRPGTNAEQMTDVVCQYLVRTPSFRDFPGTAIVSLALDEAFPCI